MKCLKHNPKETRLFEGTKSSNKKDMWAPSPFRQYKVGTYDPYKLGCNLYKWQYNWVGLGIFHQLFHPYFWLMYQPPTL